LGFWCEDSIAYNKIITYKEIKIIDREYSYAVIDSKEIFIVGPYSGTQYGLLNAVFIPEDTPASF